MNSKPASGYTHHSTHNNQQYVSWKGTGYNQFPVGTAPGNIRPLTNKDPGNVFPTGFGLPRPIKHFRKGRVIPPPPSEDKQVDYNTHRFVRSSNGASIQSTQDTPGGYIVYLNTPYGTNDLNEHCKTCEGAGLVASYKPNTEFVTETPEPATTNRVWCCNPEKKARQRAIYASTNLKKTYYTTTKQYLQNRCKTYDQKAFNFVPNRADVPPPDNLYVANCQMNTQQTEATILRRLADILFAEGILTQDQVSLLLDNVHSISALYTFVQELPEAQQASAMVVLEVFMKNPYYGLPSAGLANANSGACKWTVYKPNNGQFAQQGAVSSSTRLLKLNVDTISTNAASIQRYNNTGQFLVNANELYAGDANDTRNLLKNKAPTCNAPWPLNFSQSGQFQNKKYCVVKQR